MSEDWESTFRSWGEPPSETERTKYENAERAIRKAIGASEVLDTREVSVFAQGSYCNRTNVRMESDVDICVLCTELCFPDFTLSEGLGDADVGFASDPYTYAQFKNDVEAALRSYLGNAAVTRGNKAFDVHENTYRVDADVVPCFEHRRYQGRPGDYTYESGTELCPDNGTPIINWPQQNYDNGVTKNNATGRRFKAVVRILKRLCNEMVEESIAEAQPISSYLIECLVWNVPNEGFGHDTYTKDVQYALAHLCNETRSDDDCGEWGEINELKYLFRNQPWTRQQVNSFLNAAWNYIGFE